MKYNTYWGKGMKLTLAICFVIFFIKSVHGMEIPLVSSLLQSLDRNLKKTDLKKSQDMEMDEFIPSPKKRRKTRHHTSSNLKYPEKFWIELVKEGDLQKIQKKEEESWRILCMFWRIETEFFGYESDMLSAIKKRINPMHFKDERGRNLIDIAKEEGHIEIVSYFKTYVFWKDQIEQLEKRKKEQTRKWCEQRKQEQLHNGILQGIKRKIFL